MNELTKRFLEAYEILKSQKKVLNPSDFARKIGVSTSLITEICKKRTNAGITPIQKLIVSFPQINAAWLVAGEGEILNNNTKADTSDNYKELAEARKKTILLLERDNLRLEKDNLRLGREIKELKKDKEPEIYPRNVAEPDS